MEIRYQREFNHNYMILRGPETESAPEFECRMLSDNEIDGLLAFRLRRSGTGCEFCYEITSRQPLSRILATRKLRGDDIRCIVRGILKTVAAIREYLLEESGMLLSPDCIYADPDTLEVRFCVVPGYRGDFCGDLSLLLKLLLEKTDHQDPDGVMTAYHLYEESRKENYGMSDLIRCLKDREEELSPSPEAAVLEAAEFPEREAPEEPDSVPAIRGAPEEERGFFRREIPGRDHKRENAGPSRPGIRKTAGNAAAILLAAEFILWYLQGIRGLLLFGIFPILAAAVFFAVRIRRKKETRPREEGTVLREGRSAEPPERLRILPRTEEEEARKEEERKSRRLEKSYAEGTVMLGRSAPQPELVLEPSRRTMETVRIAYTPFVLGKHPELSDYCIREDAVSRMHARIDKTEEGYRVTDLNSTNGTSVNGRLLEANESAVLRDGDLLELAGVEFLTVYPR